MALVKPPKLNPIRPLPASKPPPVSRTRDDYTHHTSPVAGPQPEAPTQLADDSSPKARMRTLPDTPMHVTKHSNPVGRPKNRNDG